MTRISDIVIVRILCTLVISLLALAACGSSPTPEPTFTPTPTNTPAVTFTPQVTATASLTPSPAPTNTPAATSSPQTTAAPLSNTAPQPSAAPPQPGKMVADLYFRPEKNGFSFENYSSAKKYQNLTPVEMQRMFGSGVCGSNANAKCILTPPVNKLMEQYNRAMASGHCFGFSVLALRFAQNLANPADFGAKTAADLKIEGNDKLQREIAYSYSFQFFDPVNQSMVEGTPNQVLDKLIAYLKVGPTSRESYTLGFFNAQGGGGHAVTPYAVEDLGGGKFAVMVYDNNLPKTPRAIYFDRNTNSWTYSASVNPNVKSAQYVGDAETQSLFLFPTTPGLKVQTCPVCTPPDAKSATTAPKTYNAIFLHGDPRNHGHLLITDDKGRRYGYLPDGKFVREIPGAKHAVVLAQGTETDLWNDSPEPIYYVPTGTKLTTTISGSPLTGQSQTAVVAIGPGYYIGVESINLDPGQTDTLTISGDGSKLSYKAGGDEAPDIVVGFESKGPDYAFTAHQVDMKSGGALNIDLDASKGRLGLGLGATNGSGSYNLDVTRIDSAGEDDLTHEGITFAPGDTEYVDYGTWSGGGDALDLQVDHGSDGTIDQTETFENVTVEATETPEESVEATPTAEESVEATPAAEETVEATPTTEETVEATPTTEETIEATPTTEETVEATPTAEETVEVTPTTEETVEATPTPEGYLEATPTVEETIEATPTPEENLEATPTPEESVEASPTPDAYLEATPTPEENLDATPTPEDSEEATPTPEESLWTTPALQLEFVLLKIPIPTENSGGSG